MKAECAIGLGLLAAFLVCAFGAVLFAGNIFLHRFFASTQSAMEYRPFHAKTRT